MVEVHGGVIFWGVGAEVQVGEGGFAGGGAGGVAGGCASGGGHAIDLRVLAGEVAGDADGGVDLMHGPAGESVQAFPVLAEDHVAEVVDEVRGEKGCAGFLGVALDLCEELFREAGLRGELSHHGGEEDGVGGCLGGDGLRWVAGGGGGGLGGLGGFGDAGFFGEVAAGGEDQKACACNAECQGRD